MGVTLRVQILAYFAAALSTTGNALAQQDCLEVISLSATTSEVVRTEDEIARSIDRFCRTYSTDETRSVSAEARASYTVFSGGGSTSRQDYNSTFFEHCADSRFRGDSSSFYSEYVETVHPLAFSSFDACMKVSASGVNVSFPSVRPRYAFVTVSYPTRRADDRAEVQVTATDPDATCGAVGAEIDELRGTFLLPGNRTFQVRCERELPTDADLIVTRFDVGDPDAHSFTVPWREHPVDRPAPPPTQSVFDFLQTVSLRSIGVHGSNSASANARETVLDTYSVTIEEGGRYKLILGGHFDKEPTDPLTTYAACRIGLNENMTHFSRGMYGNLCLISFEAELAAGDVLTPVIAQASRETFIFDGEFLVIRLE